MYTIGQVSELFQLPVSTLRYYDKEGLFPEIKRSGGIRHFDTTELEALRLVECLKKTGMEIKNIKQFMQWCTEGSETYPKRLELIQKQKLECEKEIKRMEKALAMLKFKCWYYETALADGMRTESMKCCRIACRKKFRHTMMPHIQTDSDRNF